jgi:hypothetical protein
MIDRRPEELGQPEHAFLGAVGEHLARRWNLRIPDWTDEPDRFLHRPYFATPLEDLKAYLLVRSPLAFRRRMIFVEDEPLRRARMPRALAQYQKPGPCQRGRDGGPEAQAGSLGAAGESGTASGS